MDGATTAVWGAVLLTILNSLLAELVAVSDDDSYYSALVRRLVARNFGRAKGGTPGLLVVQIDGLSLPILNHALRGGRAPVISSLMRDGGATLHPWIALLPPTTPASQAGILHGRNDGIAGFRWYEKASARLMVANHPEDAAEIVRRVSDGAGLLVDDGASVGNLVTGDAPRSYLTMATIAEGAPSDDGRRLRGFLATSVNYIRLLVLMLGEVVKELYQAESQRGIVAQVGRREIRRPQPQAAPPSGRQHWGFVDPHRGDGHRRPGGLDGGLDQPVLRADQLGALGQVDLDPVVLRRVV